MRRKDRTALKVALSALVIAISLLTPSDGQAQSTGSGSSSAVMWGTANGAGSPNAGEAAAAHANNGAAAGQVNAAKSGLLNGQSINVYSIGVQNILSVTGNNNTVSGTSQTGTNSGSITTTGRVSGSGQ
jgi:hypothetical protein